MSNRSEILAAARGGGFLAGGHLYEFLSRFVIAFLLARLIGAEGYGLYSLAISAAAIFAGVSALGLDDAMVRYVAIMRRRGDDPGLWGTLQIGVGISTVAGVLMGGVLLVSAGPIASGMFDEPDLAPLLRVLAVAVPFLVMSNTLLGCARGFARMDYAALAENVVQSTVRMALLAGLAVVGMDVLTAVVIFAIADVTSTITLVVLLSRQVPRRTSTVQMARRDYRTVFSFAIQLWLSGVMNQFRRNIETVFLGALSSTSNVGVYAVVARVNFVGHIGYRSVIVSVKPILAALHDKGDRAGLQQLYTTATRWTFTLNIPFFLVMLLFAEPLLNVFGREFLGGANALAVLAVAELVIAGTGICGSIIDMTGHTRIKLVNTALAIAVLIVTNAALIPRHGVLGAAVAAMITTSVVEATRVVEVWVLERIQPYRQMFWKPVVAGASALALGVGLQQLRPVGTSLHAVAIQAPIVICAYVALLLTFGLEPEDRLVLERLAHRARRHHRAPQARAPQARASRPGTPPPHGARSVRSKLSLAPVVVLLLAVPSYSSAQTASRPPEVAPRGLPIIEPAPFADPFSSCTEVILPEASTVDDAEPGDVLCLPAGTRGALQLFGLSGTGERPITLVNAGGVVTIEARGAYAGIEIRDSSHVHITGTGVERRCGAVFDEEDQLCGIRIVGSENGLTGKLRTEFLTVDHVEVGHVASAGMGVHDKEFERGEWVQRQIAFRDVYLHDIATEGHYHGSSKYTDSEAVLLDGVEITRNLIVRTGRDGIQIGSAPRNCIIADNVVSHAGLNREPSHAFGIVVNRGAACDITGNEIRDSAGDGIYDQGLHGQLIANNVILRSGLYHSGAGIDVRAGNQADDNPETQDFPRSTRIVGNTVRGASRHGIRLRNSAGEDNEIVANIVSGIASGQPIRLGDGVRATVAGNRVE